MGGMIGKTCMREPRVPLSDPRPDWRRFLQAVLTQYAPPAPALAEYAVHPSILRRVATEHLGREWVEPDPADRTRQIPYWDNVGAVYHRLGYDCVPVVIDPRLPRHGHRLPARTPDYIGRNRCDLHTGPGPIRSWEDLRDYPWPSVTDADVFPALHLARTLPEGMGVLVGLEGGPFQHLAGLFGFDELCTSLYDQPGLVEAVAERLGELLSGFFERLLAIDRVAGVLQGDELAFPGGPFVSPAHLRQFVLPWHQRIAAQAHDVGKPYLLHAPGDLEAVMPDLLDFVHIDARHGVPSGQFAAFKRRWGTRVGVIGGVDVEVLTFAPPAEVRTHVRGVLAAGRPGGGFALGCSGAVHSQVPLENYLAMLDEALHPPGAEA